MNDEQLLELMKSIDSEAVRVPPGVRQIVNAVMAIEREACAQVCIMNGREATSELGRLMASMNAAGIRMRSN